MHTCTNGGKCLGKEKQQEHMPQTRQKYASIKTSSSVFVCITCCLKTVFSSGHTEIPYNLSTWGWERGVGIIILHISCITSQSKKAFKKVFPGHGLFESFVNNFGIILLRVEH